MFGWPGWTPLESMRSSTEVNMSDKKMPRYQSPCEKYTYDPDAGDYERNIPQGRLSKTCPRTGAVLNVEPRKSILKKWMTDEQVRLAGA